MTNSESPFITRVDMGLKMLMTIMVGGTKEFVSRLRTLGCFHSGYIYLTLDVVG